MYAQVARLWGTRKRRGMPAHMSEEPASETAPNEKTMSAGARGRRAVEGGRGGANSIWGRAANA